MVVRKQNLKNFSFEKVICQLIPLHIPVLYLEGYKNLLTATQKSDWPQKPKSIFTVNAYNRTIILNYGLLKK